MLIFGVFLSLAPSFSFAATREEVLSRYEKLVSLLEQSDLRTDPAANAIDRMESIHEALSGTDYDAASRQIDSLAADLTKGQASLSNDLDKEARLYWFEFLLDIFQKLAVLGLLAFLLIQNSRWRTALKINKIPNATRFVWGLLAVFVSIVFRMLDLSRYGDSVWAVFDMQVVLATVAGFLTGPFWGIIIGALMALFRLLSNPGALEGPAVILSAAVIGGLFAGRVDPYIRSGKRGFFCGAFVGLAHGCTVYLPFAGALSLGNIIFSIGLLTLLEALGVAIFFAVISAVLQSEIKKDMETELLKTQLLFLQAQLNPHFIFNALNTIAAVCSKANAPTAESLTLKLSDFLRHILDRKEDQVTLRDELGFIDSYLSLEKARFGEALQVEKSLELSEPTLALKIPLLILQPLVENAIKHGLRRKPGGGTLKISGQEKEGYVIMEIADNGAGKEGVFFEDLLSGRTDKVEGTGIGLRNIQQRLKRLYGPEYGLVFESAPARGTRVFVKFPLQKKGAS